MLPTMNKDIAPTSSAEANTDAWLPMSSDELDRQEFTRRTSLLMQRLVEQLLSEQFDLEPQDEGVSLFLLPTDDLALAHLNLARAMKVVERGQRVDLRIIQPTKVAAK
jgi:hypothetical protein